MALSGTVLIIDDEPSLRQTLTHVLKQVGCDAAGVADGPAALQRLAAAAYDLVYLDIHLPGMDGLQVLKEIHRLYPRLPVILFTAHASLQSAMEAVRLGAVDYLIKPIDPEMLIARTRVILAEQAIGRRRRDIQAQIEALQAELKRLEQPASSPPATPPIASPSGDRFLKCGQLIIDLQARRATFGERVLTIPPSAFDYLVALARHAPDVVDYQALVTEAQGYRTDRRGAQELAKWHIHELRSALELDPGAPAIVSSWIDF